VRENMWPLAFWAWLTWLEMTFSSSIHLPANDKISFFYVAVKISLCIKTTTFLIHLLIVGYLDSGKAELPHIGGLSTPTRTAMVFLLLSFSLRS
jgi:hypothetical protein